MKVLALEPYYGGSHRAFLDGWSCRSRHTWTILSLPAHNWKWRMRHAPVTFARQAASPARAGGRWDVVFCSDMLDLATFVGLAPPALRSLPAVVYFHENQLTYPVRQEDARDSHFAFTNFTTAVAAARVWFNTAFHRDSFMEALAGLLRRMPDHQSLDALDGIRAAGEVHPPGIEQFAARPARRAGPLRILWAARWEHDKGPEAFFDAIGLLRRRGVDFRLSVIGQQFRSVPEVFAEARAALAAHIDHWGCQASRAEYVSALLAADVFVSTAQHEFFGISAVEAMAAGAMPVLPRRLAYPEILAEIDAGFAAEGLYDGTVEALAERLAELSQRLSRSQLWPGRRSLAAAARRRFGWDALVGPMDDCLADAARAR